jgi:hypothetical protein
LSRWRCTLSGRPVREYNLSFAKTIDLFLTTRHGSNPERSPYMNQRSQHRAGIFALPFFAFFRGDSFWPCYSLLRSNHTGYNDQLWPNVQVFSLLVIGLSIT